MDFIATVSLLFAVVQAASAALQWSPSPINAEVIHAFAGQNVTFAWSYTAGPGETVTSVRWTYRGRSQLLIAVVVQDSFLPTPTFAQRVHEVGSAGLVLQDVTVSDTGNYTVEVIGFNSTGGSFTEHRMVCLQVAAPTALQWSPTPEDGQMIRANVDEDVTIAWDYTADPEQTITSMQWTHDGRSQETVAAVIGDGNFFSTLRFANRVQLVGGAGLQLHHVTKDDTGNYSVEIVGHDSAGVTFRQRRTVFVQVAERNSPNVAFRAKTSGHRTLRIGDTLILDQVTLNVGDAYDPITGRFTAPLDGVYYFSAMATSSVNGYSANFILESNSTAEPFLFSSFAYRQDEHSQTGSGQTTVYLRQGEQVWMVSFGDFETADRCIFSGFLLFTQ